MKTSIIKQFLTLTTLSLLSLSYACQTPIPNNLQTTLGFQDIIPNLSLTFTSDNSHNSPVSNDSSKVEEQIQAFANDLETGNLNDYYQMPNISFSLNESEDDKIQEILDNVNEITSRGLVYAQILTEQDNQAYRLKGQFFDGRFYFQQPENLSIQTSQALKILFFDLNFNLMIFDTKSQATSSNTLTLANRKLNQLNLEKNEWSLTPQELEDQLLSGSEGSFFRGTFNERQKSNLQKYTKAISRNNSDGAEYRNKLKLFKLINTN